MLRKKVGIPRRECVFRNQRPRFGKENFLLKFSFTENWREVQGMKFRRFFHDPRFWRKGGQRAWGGSDEHVCEVLSGKASETATKIKNLKRIQKLKQAQQKLRNSHWFSWRRTTIHKFPVHPFIYIFEFFRFSRFSEKNIDKSQDSAHPPGLRATASKVRSQNVH